MKSMLLGSGSTPYTDLFLPSTTWAQVGSNTITGDPFAVGTPTLAVPTSSNVGINNATLSGSITADGGSPSTATGFNYGTTTAYGAQVTTVQSIDTGPFTNNLSGLLTTTYHYQAFATNAAGTGVSPDATFQTVFSSTGGTPTTPVVVPVTPVPVGQFPIEGPNIGTSLTIYNASLLDYCNPAVKKDQAFVAICQALDPQLKAFLAEIQNCIILSNISNQPENVLDFLALYHFNVDYYDTTLPLATKLLLIQNVIQDKIGKGTPQRIIDLMNDVFAFGELIEWFNDNPVGIPNTFRIQIADPLTDPNKVANLFRAVLVAKNVRSYFAGISSFQSASFHNSNEVGAAIYDYQVIAWPRQ
jgi:phage tail P2-like protein